MPQADRNLQWVDLTDFRPGIVQRSNQALGTVAVPAPLGAAQQTNTYRCIALPSGGLGPLPRRTEDVALTVAEATAPSSSGYYVVGFFVYGPMSTGIGGQSRYEEMAFAAVAYTPSGSTQQRFRLYRIQLFNSGPPYAVDTLRSINSAYSGNSFYETTWFAPSRANVVDPTLPGNPFIAIGWATPGASNEMFISAFPNPGIPAVTALSDYTTARWGQVFGHQGRICLNEMIAYSMGATGGSFTEEQLSFTDPPNSITLGNQQEVFSQEYATGIGAFGSISAGELFLVKRQGGGVIVSGDVANPSVTRLPGVTGTGTATTNRAASSSIGLAYAVKDGGIHLWRGGDTSQKISANLDDTCFESALAAPRMDTGGLTSQPIISTAAWDQYLLVSNNWLYDMGSQSWWRIDPTSQQTIQHWSRGFSNQFMFGAEPLYGQTGGGGFHVYDRTKAATNWSWQSHPIPASINRLTDVRDMVLVAQGSGTVTVTLTAFDGATQSEIFTITNATQPQRLRPAVGGTFAKGYNVVVRIVSDGVDSAAPVVHSLHLACRDAQPAVAT